MEEFGSPAPGSRAYDLLYTDGSEVIGIDDVQLLENPAPQRIAETVQLLQSANAYIRFQAAQVLAAWGQEAGIQAIEAMIAAPDADKRNYSPHRIYGVDNRFDDLADAVDIYMWGGDAFEARGERALIGLLGLYGTHFFESKLKTILLRRGNAALAGPIRDAIGAAFAAGQPYQASQLLPPLARIDSAACRKLLPAFLAPVPAGPSPAINVAEALRYLDGPVDELVKQCEETQDRLVLSTLKESLAARGPRTA